MVGAILAEESEWPKTTQQLAILFEVSDITIRRTKQEHNIKLIFSEDILTEPNQKSIRWTKTGALKIAAHLHTSGANQFKIEQYKGKILLYKPEHDYIDIIIRAVDGFAYYEKQCCHNHLK